MSPQSIMDREKGLELIILSDKLQSGGFPNGVLRHFYAITVRGVFELR